MQVLKCYWLLRIMTLQNTTYCAHSCWCIHTYVFLFYLKPNEKKNKIIIIIKNYVYHKLHNIVYDNVWNQWTYDLETSKSTIKKYYDRLHLRAYVVLCFVCKQWKSMLVSFVGGTHSKNGNTNCWCVRVSIPNESQSLILKPHEVEANAIFRRQQFGMRSK